MDTFLKTPLWARTLGIIDGQYSDETERLRSVFLDTRTRVAGLLSEIRNSAPDLTIHDITHVDALWEIGGLLLQADETLNPAEGFVLGMAFLLHDAALSIAAFPGGLDEVRKKPEWKDAVIAALQMNGSEVTEDSISNPPPEVAQHATLFTLRLFHANQAAELPSREWYRPDTHKPLWLIQDEPLRQHYGATIGAIAQSHWFDPWDLPSRLSPIATAGPGVPGEWTVSPVRLASILRVADAAHLDHRRAPAMGMAIVPPLGESLKYWTFQNQVGKPAKEGDSLVFSGGPFGVDEADAWWACHDALHSLDDELRQVDAMLQDRASPRLAVRRVAGIESPRSLSRFVSTVGWHPVDAAVKVSDVRRVVEMLGGRKLYGEEPLAAVRELIQNSADAIRAKQLLVGTPPEALYIRVRLSEREGQEWWLSVSDNGIGMSRKVLTGALLDFGSRFWAGALMREEFPGLLGKGMVARGAFGIGFFSVFMLGDRVVVTSWKHGTSTHEMHSLDFRGGLDSRPILRQPAEGEALSESGTCVSVRLRRNPRQEGGLLWNGRDRKGHETFRDMFAAVAALAPALDVTIRVQVAEVAERDVVQRSDWVELPEQALVGRIAQEKCEKLLSVLRPLKGPRGETVGRAAISVAPSWISDGTGVVTVDGLSVSLVNHVTGILVGSEAETVARDVAFPAVPLETLSVWATEQAILIHDLALTKQLDPFSSNDETLGQIAAVILKFGGDVGPLPICTIGDTGLSTAEIRDRLADLKEILIVEGSIQYDEDEDNVLPRDFSRDFEIDDELLVIPTHSPTVLRVRDKTWPDCLFPAGEPPKTLSDLVWATIEDVWPNCSRSEVEAEVGTVDRTEIRRTVACVVRE